MSWTPDDIPDQTGRIAVVTGANGGLGLETTRELARRGAHMVMAARNLDKAETARSDILTEIPDASLEVRGLDLASLDSIHRFASDVLAAHPTIDLLINNAGVMGTPRRETADGFELQFGTNHLGHFALTRLLMPALLRSDAARVVTVTSTGRLYGGSLNRDDPHLTESYAPWKAYGQSKMANMRFALELDRRLQAAGAPIRSLAAHPGFANTDLQAASVRANGGGASQRFFHRSVGMVGMSPAEGALPQLRAATDPAAAGGTLYTPRWVNAGAPVRRPVTRSRNVEEQEALWELSERETGIEFDVPDLTAAAR